VTYFLELRRRAAESRQGPRAVGMARVLALLIVLVAGLDVVSTNMALAAGHVEGNPLIAALQASLGPWWSGPKVAFHLAIAYFVLWLPSRKMLAMSCFLVTGYALIAVNNIYWTTVAVS